MSATGSAGNCVSDLVAMLIVSPSVRRSRLRGLRRRPLARSNQLRAVRLILLRRRGRGNGRCPTDLWCRPGNFLLPAGPRHFRSSDPIPVGYLLVRQKERGNAVAVQGAELDETFVGGALHHGEGAAVAVEVARFEGRAADDAVHFGEDRW